MNQENKTNWKKLYAGLIIVTFLMMIAMYIFQNYYK